MIATYKRKAPICRGVFVGGVKLHSGGYLFQNKPEIEELLLEGCVLKEDITFDKKTGTVSWPSKLPRSCTQIVGDGVASVGQCILWDPERGFGVFNSYEELQEKYQAVD